MVGYWQPSNYGLSAQVGLYLLQASPSSLWYQEVDEDRGQRAPQEVCQRSKDRTYRECQRQVLGCSRYGACDRDRGQRYEPDTQGGKVGPVFGGIVSVAIKSWRMPKPTQKDAHVPCMAVANASRAL